MSEHEDAVVGLLEREQNRIYGKYRGVVAEIGTGDRLGKLKVQIPDLFADKKKSVWAEPVVPFAGDEYGVLYLPEDKQGVWIEFEMGDPSKPLWCGAYWAKNHKKPSPAAEQVRVIVSKNKHQIVLDDKKDEIRLVHNGGPSIVIGKDSITLTVSGKKIVIDKSSVNLNDGNLKVE